MSMFLACILTVFIETPLLYLFGHRDRESVIIVICTNVVTNLLINLTLLLAFPAGAGAWVYLMEAAVVVAEYWVYALAFEPSWKLLVQTFSANCLSYGIGLLIF